MFENWESEFLQMAVFILLTTCLVHTRLARITPAAQMKELVDADPRRFADPVPTRHGRCGAAAGS